jgi:hypothetical protein
VDRGLAAIQEPRLTQSELLPGSTAAADFRPAIRPAIRARQGYAACGVRYMRSGEGRSIDVRRADQAGNEDVLYC